MRLTDDEKATYQAEAAQLRRILATGVTEVSVDSQRTTFDLDQCRARYREINRLLNPRRFRIATRMNLGGG